MLQIRRVSVRLECPVVEKHAFKRTNGRPFKTHHGIHPGPYGFGGVVRLRVDHVETAGVSDAAVDNDGLTVQAKIAALEPDPLPPVVIGETKDAPVTSEIIYPTVNFDKVAPFGAPVGG